MILSGCMLPPTPIPWPASKAHVTEEQAKALEPTAMDRDAVRAALGDPDLRRDHDRLWIYGSSETEGKWLINRDSVMEPLLRSRRVVFLTFDDRGILTSRALVQSGMKLERGKAPSLFCTDAELCVDGWHQKLHGGDKQRLDDADTAVFRKSVLPPRTPVSPDSCRLIAVVDESWPNLSPLSFSFRVDERWSGFARLSPSAVATIDLEPGKHHLAAPDVPDEFFDCPPGQTIAVKLHYEAVRRILFLPLPHSRERIVSTPLRDPELAAALAKPCLILPDVHAVSDEAEH